MSESQSKHFNLTSVPRYRFMQKKPGLGCCTSPRDKRKKKLGKGKWRERETRRWGRLLGNNNPPKKFQFLERYLNCRKNGHCVPSESRSLPDCSCGVYKAPYNTNMTVPPHSFRVHFFPDKNDFTVLKCLDRHSTSLSENVLFFPTGYTPVEYRSEDYSAQISFKAN